MPEKGGLRPAVGFTEHRRINWTDFPGSPDKPDNIVLPRAENIPDWIPNTTAMIGEWRSKVCDVYLRWAITINAMHESQDSWSKKAEDRALKTVTMRPDKKSAVQQITLAVWPAKTVAENYRKATPILSAYGFTDMFGLLEEIVFEWHVILLNDDPVLILKGPEFKELRRYYAQRDDNEKAMQRWLQGWGERLESWRRKRLYDGLHKVFLSYFERSKLKRPSQFTQTDISDWAKTIECIAEIRNLLVHGESIASARLEKLCEESVGNVLSYKAGQALDVRLEHLMYFEMFCDQILSSLNVSLVEAYEEYR
ncbi:hypothetical protein [Mesorhizobium sp.]|uniref:hypothetical protein n=1 Tax=Mesorhizobium sp. TaxID=1871066 RepID=UPI000FE46AA2|nr:hypothetical protein [Mesorhizobium sp.]RWK43754.1 MAG: hypothetical protein EOR46_04715 [Mesorhizobium sp.]